MPLKALFFLMTILLLTACGQTKILYKTNTVVIEPPAQLYECDPLPVLPPSETLTIGEASELIVTYEQALKSCRMALDAIRGYVAIEKLNHSDSQ